MMIYYILLAIMLGLTELKVRSMAIVLGYQTMECGPFGTLMNGTNGLLEIFKILDQKSEELGQKQMQSAHVSVEKLKKQNGIILIMSQFGILVEVKFRLNV